MVTVARGYRVQSLFHYASGNMIRLTQHFQTNGNEGRMRSPTRSGRGIEMFC